MKYTYALWPITAISILWGPPLDGPAKWAITVCAVLAVPAMLWRLSRA